MRSITRSSIFTGVQVTRNVLLASGSRVQKHVFVYRLVGTMAFKELPGLVTV